MYCQKCGTENPDNAQVCSSCSSALTNTPAQTQPPNAKTSGLAIASLVLAILAPFTCLMTAMPAIILGSISLVRIQKSSGQLTGSGLAIAGIIIGPVWLPVMGCLIGILIPTLSNVKKLSYQTTCAINMSNLGKAMLIYANDYEQKFPTSEHWCDLLLFHADAEFSMFCCKGSPGGPCNYAINKNVEELGTSSPPDMVLLFETNRPGWCQDGGPEILTTNHHNGEGCNILFVDGHVEFVRTKDLNRLKWTPNEKTQFFTER